MKLVRYGAHGNEKPGLIDKDGALRDLSEHVADIDPYVLGREGRARLAAIDPASLPEVEGTPRFGAPVAPVSKIICVGMNYARHAAETGQPVPAQPVLFMKATTAIMGPNDDVVIPRGSTCTDWEVELGVVIGETARDVSVDEALAHVAGFIVINDLSEREFQLEHGGQWVKGKSCDTFAPLGPFLATRDEIPNPQALPMWLKVNDLTRQNSTTAQMIFNVPQLVSYISQFMSLLPGDIISTGTPPGVGLGLKPEPVFLKAGDVVELGIEGLGTSRQKAVSAA